MFKTETYQGKNIIIMQCDIICIVTTFVCVLIINLIAVVRYTLVT